MLGTFCEEPLQTPSTNHSAFLSSAVNSTFYKENSYNDLQHLTLFNDSNTIKYVMEASDYTNSLLLTTSKCSHLPITCKSSNSISQVNTNLKFMVSQNQPFPNTIEKLSYPTIKNSSEVLLTVHKRIKDIGSISKRQFQRRIKNKLQLLHNNNPAIPINPDIQSSSQVPSSITLSKGSSNEEINSIGFNHVLL
eukprot:XP_016660756.1 PREDICTED: uncharacterized protein LOC100571678 isoform X1 [Acyrthosiphon pisum]